MPYLTPDIGLLSESPDCRNLQVSGDLWYLVTGALSELTKPWNWEESGTATVEDMVAYFSDVLDLYAVSECGGNSMNLLASGLTLYNANGNNSNPPQIQILKSNLPAELADMVGGLCFIKSSIELERTLTEFPFGTPALQTIMSLPAGDNFYTQGILMFDSTGAKINIGGFGAPTYWSYQIVLTGWW